jgi:hypothetical protein
MALSCQHRNIATLRSIWFNTFSQTREEKWHLASLQRESWSLMRRASGHRPRSPLIVRGRGVCKSFLYHAPSVCPRSQLPLILHAADSHWPKEFNRRYSVCSHAIIFFKIVLCGNGGYQVRRSDLGSFYLPPNSMRPAFLYLNNSQCVWTRWQYLALTLMYKMSDWQTQLKKGRLKNKGAYI